MSEQLLDLLKLGLLAFLYLFFLYVIWAVWTELRTPALEPRAVRAKRTQAAPAPRRAKRSRGRAPTAIHRLRVVEPAELVGAEYAIAPEMTLGRAPGCTVVVDDTYVSQIHARVFADGDGYKVEDLGSTNGTFHNGTAVSAPQPIAVGDRIQVGNLVLDVS